MCVCVSVCGVLLAMKSCRIHVHWVHVTISFAGNCFCSSFTSRCYSLSDAVETLDKCQMLKIDLFTYWL